MGIYNIAMPGKKRGKQDVGADPGVLGPASEKQEVKKALTKPGVSQLTQPSVTTSVDIGASVPTSVTSSFSADEKREMVESEVARLESVPKSERTPDQQAALQAGLNKLGTYGPDDWEAAQPVPVY